jgi:hypothetical protein
MRRIRESEREGRLDEVESSLKIHGIFGGVDLKVDVV